MRGVFIISKLVNELKKEASLIKSQKEVTIDDLESKIYIWTENYYINNKSTIISHFKDIIKKAMASDDDYISFNNEIYNLSSEIYKTNYIDNSENKRKITSYISEKLESILIDYFKSEGFYFITIRKTYDYDSYYNETNLFWNKYTSISHKLDNIWENYSKIFYMCFLGIVIFTILFLDALNKK